MGYLVFRGVSTQSLAGVAVAKMPSHKKASMRFTEYYVKGRDGALHVDEGLSNFDITATLVLINASAATRQIVNAWADGTGKLVLSDNTTKAYKATVKEEIKWSRLKANAGYYDTAEITFNCQPCMYEAEDTVIELTQSAFITNPGSAVAYPLLKIEASGDASIIVGGEEITIDDMTTGVPVYIDCENGYVYTETGATTMHGDIPVIPLGESAVDVGPNVTKLTITPHWRWV